MAKATHRALEAFIVVSTTLFATNARGQQPSEAQRLFDQGLEAMQQGQFETGCPALEASYELEKLPGVLFTLAECQAAWGKLASAVESYQSFLELLTKLAQDLQLRYRDRRQFATQKIASLAPLVPRLAVEVPPNAPKSLRVELDGIALRPTSFGVLEPVDPGDHEVIARLGNDVVFRRKVHLVRGASGRIDVRLPAGKNEPIAPQPLPPTHPPAGGQHPQTSRWAYVLGAVGVIGVGVSAGTGYAAWRKKDVIDRECEGRRCTTDGLDAVDNAQSLGVVSTVTLGVGLAAITGGAILLLSNGTGGNEASALTVSNHGTAGVVAHWRASF